MQKIKEIIEILETVSAKDIVCYDFEKTSPFYDYFIIATANDRQSNAAINHLKKAFKDDIRHVEGKGGSWVLIDVKDIIIHIFSADDRKYYNFEQRLLGVKKVI